MSGSTILVEDEPEEEDGGDVRDDQTTDVDESEDESDAYDEDEEDAHEEEDGGDARDDETTNDDESEDDSVAYDEYEGYEHEDEDGGDARDDETTNDDESEDDSIAYYEYEEYEHEEAGGDIQDDESTDVVESEDDNVAYDEDEEYVYEEEDDGEVRDDETTDVDESAYDSVAYDEDEEYEHEEEDGGDIRDDETTYVDESEDDNAVDDEDEEEEGHDGFIDDAEGEEEDEEKENTDFSWKKRKKRSEENNELDELLSSHKQARKGDYADSVEKRLEDEFEPGVPAVNYMTEKDKEIQDIDIPERIQLFEEITGPVPKDDESIQAESTWIYNQLVAPAAFPIFEKEKASEVTKDIGNVLGMLHVQKYDIPFIAMYRKELCLSLLKDPYDDITDIYDRDKTEKTPTQKHKAKKTPTLTWQKVLWDIQNLAKKWLLLQKRKSSLQLYYSKRAAEEASGDLSKKVLASLLESLKYAELERDVDEAIQNLDKKWRLLQKRTSALQLHYNKRVAEASADLSKNALLDSFIVSLKDAESEGGVDKAIQNLDKRWLLLRKRSALQLYYNKCAAEEASTDLLKKALLNSLIKSLKDAKSEIDIDVIDSKFNLHFPPDEVDQEEVQFKRSKQKSIYSIYHKAGLDGAASKFGFSPEQLGKRLNLEQMWKQPVDARNTPEDVAAAFVSPEFETPQDVLKGARYMAAVDISCDPLVRKHIRNAYMNNGVISTRPTPDGNTAIGLFHQFSSVKCLRDKPISLFNDAQWLLIQKAEEEKLLQVTIKLPESGSDQSLIQEFEEKYLSDGVSKAAQVWNEQRKLILKEALFNYLIPLVEKEVRSLLNARAKSWLCMEYGTQLWHKVHVKPYKWMDNFAAPRVMACCWGPGKRATTFVMLDSLGEVLDVLYTPYLSVHPQCPSRQQLKKNDQKEVIEFMIDHQPHVVVLGAASLSCEQLLYEINEIITKMLKDYHGEVGKDMDGIKVLCGCDSLPRLYENSRISSDQLPGQPGIVRRAVALGRYLQNPLAMVATLCGPEKEILSLNLHHLQHFLTPDERYEVIEQVMIDATNQVGVDVNLAACHEWLFAPLQFVSGLGPRKASSLQRAIVNAGWVNSRKEILQTNLGALKRNVFINAAGFLRVRASGQAACASQIMDLLDDTRIHPESYALAKKMVKHVYAAEVAKMGQAQEMAIVHARNNPKSLRVLDIDEYAKNTGEQLGSRKRETLYDIKMGLLHGFQDWRIPGCLCETDLFYMIYGETKETLARECRGLLKGSNHIR